MSAPLVLSVLILIINVGLWLFFYIKFKTEFSSAKVLENIRREVDKLLIEIQRETENTTLLIEARIEGLKQLIDEADKRISIAEGEIKKRRHEKQVLSKLHAEETVPVKKTQVQKKLEAYEILASPTPAPNTPPEVEVAVEPELFNQEPQFSVAQEPVKIKKSVKDKIIEMYKQDFTTQYIAKELGISVSEVDFLINMFKNSK
ncbi:MAG: hypothetical protein J6T84_03980 [Spirochaetaceae bacterium]|nr:hypothetical protein [Spirochaetaceae bacterium]